MARITVTGASGFLGKRTVAALIRRGHSVRAVSRDVVGAPEATEVIAAGDLLEANLEAVVANSDVVVNCAASVRRAATNNHHADRMNHDFAVALASAAKSAKAARFVQLSSVAAITSFTRPGEIVDDETCPTPQTIYGESKLKADVSLNALSDTSFSVISLRPPVIIGSGAAAWFALLDRAARLGIPLPVGRINNRRSYAFIDNVADAVATAANSTIAGSYIVTDSDPISTAQLYRCLLTLHGRPDRVWRWPVTAMRIIAQIALRSRASSLLGNAVYDGSRFRAHFGWAPPVPFRQALKLIVADSARATRS